MTEYLIGGYGPDMGGDALGIARGRSHADGRFEFLGLVAEATSPAWLARDGDAVHAALEGSGEVQSFELEEGLALRPGARVDTGGEFPCHLAVVGRGAARAVVAACYGDGSLAVLPVGAEGASEPVQRLAGTGSGPLPAQRGPHAHHVLPLPDGSVLTADLGADAVHRHRVEVAGGAVRLEREGTIALPPGTGPRDLLALPDGRVAVLGEWACDVHLLSAEGDVVARAVLPDAERPAGDDGEPRSSQAAALALSADGRFLVAGVRGANRVAVLALDGDGLSPVGSASSGGDWPRHLVVDGGFVHVANQLSGTVATLRLASDGALDPVGDPVAVPSPTCLLALA